MFEEGGQRAGSDTGWAHIANHDKAATVIDTILRLDSDEKYTKTALSEAAGVPLKTLYLDGTLEELVTVGLLEKHEAEGEETLFSVDDGSAAFEAAKAFDTAAATSEEADS
ncbi:hypothetical protein [Haloarcula argentinensis]|uniref:Transcriptional regulator n=1 Tax=Haloarcula argentinensis TaxID=43776 RepID=A0A830FVP6_HALAR|nr:hypothetical protein [Haloarcula argentinensis]EMA18756.1 hypothetical protein C443_19709 [Haloarcula argentinensis DSM 12282]MDS0253683.1 hypothetical protein [Haloarcula argentinensis]GGM47581.1 hypothetical protein GCM10009006_30980 [Haloarcula argentinensis]